MKNTVKTQKVEKKWIITGIIETLSPLVIGTGDRDSDTDIIIQRDENGNPFIPATSFSGALNHFFFEETELKGHDEDYEKLWGVSKKEKQVDNQKAKHISIKSKIFFSDLKLTENSKAVVELRDGIRIDNKTGLVEDTGKYDYEMLARGATFNLRIEINQEEAFSEDLVKRFILTFKEQLEVGNIAIGSKNTSGFGKIKLKDAKIFEYDFSEKSDVLSWLSSETKQAFDCSKFSVKAFEPKKNRSLEIALQLKLKTSLLIRSYSPNPNEPDSAFITSNGKAVIPGTSAKGALTARAKKILRTFLHEKAEKLEKSLFGYVSTENDDENDGEKIKSRFIVQETYMNLNNFARKIQARIKIDRFTGGTIKTALFDEMPLWPSESDEYFEVKYAIKNFDDWEAGLAFLVMRELMTSDLAIGGGKSIGRGVFTGEKATITVNGERIEITQHENNTITVKTDDKEKLEKYVKSFNQKMQEEKGEGQTV